MPYDAPPELAGLSLQEIAEAMQSRRLPPLKQWTPENTGDSEMAIAADGSWTHQGSAITRPAMVRAFASLLMRDDDGQSWLVTPYQKLSIQVADAEFVATDFQVREDDRARPALAFRINTDEFVIAGPNHPIIARGEADTPSLYLGVRHGTEARLNRSTYHQLVEYALEVSNPDGPKVESKGMVFPLIPASGSD